MTTSRTPRHDRSQSVNHLRRGASYRIGTPHGDANGEYLGMESPHGERAILLRHRTGTASIPLDDVTSIRQEPFLLDAAG